MEVVAIIGAGPAGLAAARVLADYPDRFMVHLLDRNPKPGRKLLATGNGKCNLSNLNMRIDKYHGQIDHLYGWVSAFKAEPYFASVGLYLRRKGPLLYPYSEQASTVLDVLFNDLLEHGVNFMPERKVVDFRFVRGRYVLIDQQGREMTADHVILAGGGKAASKLGSDGSLLALLRAKGVHITPLYPSLVQIKTQPAYPSLKGCRVHGTFFLYRNHQQVACFKGEVLFTEDGISGIAALELSSYLDHGSHEDEYIVLDLADELSDESLMAYYRKWGQEGFVLQRLLPQKLALVLEKTPISNEAEFLHLVKHWTLKVAGTRGFESAQVTSGGIDLNELDDGLMFKRFKHLYAAGEILNVDGDCGGYNLHFAFASGQKVGQTIVEQSLKNKTHL